MPDRRKFVGAVAGAVLLNAFPAHAQSATKIPRIGVLYTGTLATAGLVSEAFDQGLREHGYVEGKNIVVERRFGDAKPERLADLAADLVRLKVDLIVTSVDEAIAAIRRQTQTIPIVATASTDPVATGFVASLARPGGNVTGLAGFSWNSPARGLNSCGKSCPGSPESGSCGIPATTPPCSSTRQRRWLPVHCT